MPKYQEPNLPIGPVGANIYRTRNKLNITQKELAAPEFSISYISAIERGRIRPSLKALDVLARRLGVTPAELLADNGETPERAVDAKTEGQATSSLSLSALIRLRRTSYPIPLALVWANIALAQRQPGLAKELLEQLSPGDLSAEQNLLRALQLSRIFLATRQPTEVEVTLKPIFQQDEFKGYPELLERCRFRLACAYQQQGKFLLAAETFTACTNAIEQGIVTDPLFAIEVYAAVAEYHRRLDRRDTAVECYRQALTQLHLLLEPDILAEISAQLGQQHLESGRTNLASLHAARSLTFYELRGAYRQITQVASNLGLTFQEMGDFDSSKQYLRHAIDLSDRLGIRHQGILARLALADLLLEHQEALQAEHFALEAEALCRAEETNDGTILYGRVLMTLGIVHKMLTRLEEAGRAFQQAIATLERQNAPEHLSRAYFHYSELLQQQGEFAAGYELARQAYLLGQRRQDELP